MTKVATHFWSIDPLRTARGNEDADAAMASSKQRRHAPKLSPRLPRVVTRRIFTLAR